MSQPTEKRAVLFADICGSTSLYERLGDELARQLISGCIALMLDETRAHGGTLIKTIGDEIMCTFPTADAAINAACAMQANVEGDNQGKSQPMHIRIGFHYGDVICEGNDVFGDTVNVAARVAGITRAGQIMTTLPTVNALPAAMRDKTCQIMRAALKGKQEQLDIFRAIWEPDDTLRTRVGLPNYRKPEEAVGKLFLKYHGRTLEVDENRPVIMVGRDEICDLVVLNDFVSRQHLRVECRFGKFVATDQSTNGTTVRFDKGTVVRLSREDITLHGTGTMSLGQAHGDNPDEWVEFAIVYTP